MVPRAILKKKTKQHFFLTILKCVFGNIFKKFIVCIFFIDSPGKFNLYSGVLVTRCLLVAERIIMYWLNQLFEKTIPEELAT